MHDKIYVSAEDERYPTIVIESDNGSVGYSVNLSTGELRLVCVCAARCSSECGCGYEYLKEKLDKKKNM